MMYNTIGLNQKTNNMELREQIDAVEWTIHHLLFLAEAGKDDISIDNLIALNSAKYELETLLEERELQKRG